VQEELKQ